MRRGWKLRVGMTPLLLLLLGAACARTDSGRGGKSTWKGAMETLPTGAVRVLNPPEGIWEQGGEPWRLEPELVLGELEGADARVFGSISGLAVGRDGRLYVLDRQANELRIFAPDGTHVRTVGRSGGGPGEYAAANGLAWIAEDTLLVVDQQGSRYTILNEEGDYVRSVRRRLGFYGWVFSGGLAAGRVYETSFLRDGDDAKPVLLGTSLRASAADTALETSRPEATGPEAYTGAVDTVMLPETAGPLYESFSVRTDRGGMVIGVPYTGRPVYHLDGAGNLWYGHGSQPRIFESAPSGDTLAEIVLQATPAPVTDEELAEWQARPFVEQFRNMGGDLELSRIPKVKPFFDGIYVDPDEYVWLSVPTGPAETVFSILDPDGRYLGHLRVDGVRRAASLPPVVRDDRLYMVGSDELDVQRVYRFRIER